MTEDTKPEIVATLEDDTGQRSVDILRHAAAAEKGENRGGHFTYVEYHRTSDEADEWREVVEEGAKTYTSQFAAYTAATRNVDWLMD
ncbi:hypothetical protein OAN307_c14900 [Octadecabacter antarcticus 307]|uniref:Uncharacterized protein n=1 Tax=Octadecabacter antarcticus 307 TaxID=391626 RepID=M9RBG5_9RHOB|nr:hypothetical protein [Octadecabacter antarcticus]AGI67165.1 hypothetical protein OAN307_c14900 [Octadecabacter antarcticus 307]